jgi:ribosomal-protein-alanine N-acetyltransferase
VERIETARLRLEPLDASHADALYRIHLDPDVGRHLLRRPADRAEFDAAFAHMLAFGRTHGMWAPRDRASDGLIGRVGFFSFSEAQRPEVACLLARAHWGHGLGAEAVRAAVGWATRRHGWDEVVALARPQNAAAERLLASLGFERERLLDLAGGPAWLHRAALPLADTTRVR